MQAISQNFPKFPSGENHDCDNSLSEQQRAAIVLLASGKTYGAAAQAIGVDRRTLFNWRRDPAFADALRRFRHEAWHSAVDQLRALVHPALKVLTEELSAPNNRSRFRAAVAVLRAANIRSVAPRLDDESLDETPRG